MPGALDGVRVIDLTTVVMGPLGTRILADHGADVIRVEGPEVRYDLRDTDSMSSIALNTNRNKRSIQLDLKTDSGRQAVLALIDTADVFVSNLRAAALERLGLTADVLRARNPRLIHCVANGYGADGPYADLAAYDDAIQAASGLASLKARIDGEPGYVPSIVADKVCGLVIAQSVLAAIVHQRTTGEGQTISVPMFETMAAFNLIEHFRAAAYDPPRGPVGYERLLTKNRKPFRCADGWAALLPYSDANYRAFFDLIGRPELADDERFVRHESRIANVDELYAIIAEAAPMRTVAEWLAVCAEHSIPASPLIDLGDLPDDPHVQAVGLIESVEHPHVGGYRTINDPVRYDTLDTSLRRHAPLPDQHNDEVLGELT